MSSASLWFHFDMIAQEFPATTRFWVTKDESDAKEEKKTAAGIATLLIKRSFLLLRSC